MRLVIRTAAMSALALLLLTAPLRAQTAAAAADDDRWHFAVAPYFWAAGISGTASFKGIPEQPVDASFSDIIEKFDIGVATRFEARKARWGLATDFNYLNLGASIPTREGTGLDRKVYKIATKGPVVGFVYGW